MKTPEWLKEVRAWLGTAALLGILVLAYYYLRNSEAERRERNQLLQSIREKSPEEQVDKLKKAAKEQASRDAQGR